MNFLKLYFTFLNSLSYSEMLRVKFSESGGKSFLSGQIPKMSNLSAVLHIDRPLLSIWRGASSRWSHGQIGWFQAGKNFRISLMA